MLGDLGKDGVPELVEAGSPHSGDPVADDQGEDEGGQRVARIVDVELGHVVEAVDGMLEHERHRDVEELGADEEGKRDHDPGLDFWLALQIWHQVENGTGVDAQEARQTKFHGGK